MKILVTGGLGYIGSHTVVELQEQGYEVVVIDNLSNSERSVLDGIKAITGKSPAFYPIDLRDKAAVLSFFKQHSDIKGVIHFAASKAVGESVERPLFYYENNIAALVYLLQGIKKHGISHFIFSSSCTVYGQADELPITEYAPLKKAESPYGNTKQIGERILEDLSKIQENFKAIALRYFNPIGAHPSVKIGELPIGVPQNLIPFITQTAIGKRKELAVFGDDYPTRDGTCIRDYIYVVDLARAHVKALKRLLDEESDKAYEIFNLGTGEGSSVMEVIQAFEKTTGQKLPYQIAGRRAGDVTAAYADTRKANEILNWTATHSLEDALASAWAWEKMMAQKK